MATAHTDHHHEETFISKYIFSQDHKMISKQFLITGMIMAVIGMIMSRCSVFNSDGKESPFGFLTLPVETSGLLMEFLIRTCIWLVTIHGTIMVFFLLTGGLSGTFANLLIPFQIGARDMASGFINMLSYWFFLRSSIVYDRFSIC